MNPSNGGEVRGADDVACHREREGDGRKREGREEEERPHAGSCFCQSCKPDWRDWVAASAMA
jgi:hypothetical protein